MTIKVIIDEVIKEIQQILVKVVEVEIILEVQVEEISSYFKKGLVIYLEIFLSKKSTNPNYIKLVRLNKYEK
jgi:hypothetical protein